MRSNWIGIATVLVAGACGDRPGDVDDKGSATEGEATTGLVDTTGSVDDGDGDSTGSRGSSSASGSTSTGGATDCSEVDCGDNASCAIRDEAPTCACNDGFVDVDATCVSTDAWKLDEGHWVPAKMPMTVVHPRPDRETQTWARHRVAHPEFRYEIPVGVQGGAWPFLYELVDAPDGASVGQIYGQDNYGVVTWEPSAAGNHTFQVRITDQDLQTSTAAWTVTVDAEAFVFVDGDNGDDAAVGTVDDPLQSFSGWYRDDVTDDTFAGKIMVFREASVPYVIIGDAVNANGNCRLNSDTKSIVWIGYPDETPILDASQSKVFLEAPREDLYVAGLRFEHGRQDVANAQFFWVTGGGDRITFWRNTWFDLGPGQVGNDNTGPVFISGTGPEKRYILSKENIYEEINNAGFNGHFLEVYRSSYVLYEQELARNCATAAGWYPKGAIANITVRNNTAIDGVSGGPIRGSFGGEAGQLPHDHEFCFNNVRVDDGDGFLFSSSNAYEGEHYGGSVYRNTFVGSSPWLRFEGAQPYETDGNVVVTDDPSMFGEGIVIHPTIDDLLAAPSDGVVDETNRLTGPARDEHLGLRGHEID